MSIETARQTKADKWLDEKYKRDPRDESKVITCREWVKAKLELGYFPRVVQVLDAKAAGKAQKELDGINKRYCVGLSNPNIPEVKRGLELRDKLMAGITMPEYRLEKGQFSSLQWNVINSYEFALASDLMGGHMIGDRS